MIRKILLFLLLTGPLFAQTTVTGTIVDPNGNPYANGTASAYSLPASGQPVLSTSPVTTSASGFFSLSLSAANYVFTICAPPVGLGPTQNPTPKQICFSSQPVAISGPVQDVSSALNPLALVLGPMFGAAAAPASSVSVAPGTVNFGAIQTGSVSPVQNIAITNTGSVGIVVISVAFSGNSDFSSSNAGICNGVLPAGAACVVPITFSPTAAASETATVTVATSAPSSSGSSGNLPNTVNLSGTGTAGTTFPLTLSCAGTGSGSVASNEAPIPFINCACSAGASSGACSNNYANGSTPSLNETPSAQSVFLNFAGGGCGVTNPCVPTISAPTNLIVTFNPVATNFTLSLTGLGQGTGTTVSDVSAPGGILNCLSTAGVVTSAGNSGCSGVFPQGTVIVLTPTASGGSTSAGCTPSCTVTLNSNQTVSIGFTPTTVPLSKADGFFVTNTATSTTIVGTYTVQHAGGMDVCFLETNGAVTVSTVTDTAGNTWAALNTKTTNGTFNQIAWGVNNIAAAATNTVTVTYSGTMTFRSMRCLSYDGVITGGGFVDQTANGQGSSATPAAGNLTTTVGNDLLVCGTTSGAAVKTVATGYVQQILDAPFNDDVADQQGVTIGTYNCQPVLTSSASWVSQNIAFKAQQTTGGVTVFVVTIGGGTSTGNGVVTFAGNTCTIAPGGQTSGVCSAQIAAGSAVSFVSSASAGSSFVNWSGITGCNTAQQCILPSLTQNSHVGATFNIAPSNGAFNVLAPPPVSNRPYPTAYYNQQLPGAGTGGPPSNHWMPNSAAIVNQLFATAGVTSSTGWWSNELGTNDAQHRPVYYGQATDPVYQVAGCSFQPSYNGLQFHAPSGAPYSQSDNDEEIVIWDQPSNLMWQFYSFNSCTTNCLASVATLPACSGTASSPCIFNHNGNGYCSSDNRTSQSGVGGGSGASTAGLSPFGNTIRFTEILNAVNINHGIRLLTYCDGTNGNLYPSRTVFPANQSGGGAALNCGVGPASGIPDTNRPPNGAHFFLDYTTAQLNCFDPTQAACANINKLPTWQFLLIKAMTLYGGTIEDTGPGNSLATPGIESAMAMRFYDSHGYPGALNQATAWTSYMNGNCTAPSCTIVPKSNGSIVWRLSMWAGISNVNGVGVVGHIHIADPCVTIALQGFANDGHGTAGCP